MRQIVVLCGHIYYAEVKFGEHLVPLGAWG